MLNPIRRNLGNYYQYTRYRWFLPVVLVIGMLPGSHTALADEAADRPPAAVRILNASPGVIDGDPELAAFVEQTAEPVIAEYCTGCHGAGLRGRPGVPDLLDYAWLWGSALDYSAVGAVMSIQRTIRYGIRNRDCPPERMNYGACTDTRFSQMPAYGNAGQFSPDQIRDLVEYVVSLSGREADPAAAARGGEHWVICSECHGEFGEGVPAFGGPNLTDEVTLYGKSREIIHDVIYNGREGVCPPWGGVLDAATIKALAVYIYNKGEH